ncbi:MAG: hypothetical protein FH748_04290 [Balneolaceae bacterium]|nr:hypothetical protein [Balneolaceae bacterium]
MKVSFLFCLAIFWIADCSDIHAQIYGSNTFEFQYGNLPFEEDTDLTTSYDLLNLYYDQGNISAYGRFEQFLTPHESRNYFKLTQKRLQYEDDHFEVKVGNFYKTIGRGLLLRSYEIPGSVYEDNFYRTRYAFNRDQEGISLGYSSDHIEIVALHAKPLFNPLPPNFEPDSLRRPDLVEAIEASIILTKDLTVGGAYMRSSSDTDANSYREFGSFILNANLPFQLQLYSEYAFETDVSLFGFNPEDSYALYTGLNYYYGSFGLSAEYKNYNSFKIGSGFNDPPSLIKEHTYPVLNRSTHVLNTSNETGFQVEAFYHFEGGHSLTANVTAARNEVFNVNHYREYFVEGLYQYNEFLSVKSFIDYAIDELKQEDNRWSLGLITEKSFNHEWSLTADLQYQTYKQTSFAQQSENYYGAISFSMFPSLTISAIAEASTDLLLTDNPRTFEVEENTRSWFGGNIRYKINYTHTLDIFAGQRRGGPACTSGICYEILDFEGVEIRFSTRF